MSAAKDKIESVAKELGLTMQAKFVPWSKSRSKDEKSPSLNWEVTISKTIKVPKMRQRENYNPKTESPVMAHEALDGQFTDRDSVILTTDYGAGCGHCPSYKASVKELGNRNSVMRDEAIRKECETGLPTVGGYTNRSSNPILPDFCDVLASLASDASVLDSGTFEEWAGEFGYDTDSRKAEATYRACLEIALKLRNGIGEDGLRRLQEACQDY